MNLPVRRKFLDLVIHKLAIARELGYKRGWVWHDIKREIYESREFDGVYQSELAYLARRLHYRPKWAVHAYNGLEERLQLGESPIKQQEQETRSQSNQWQEPPPKQKRYEDPLSLALEFFGLPRGFSWVELKKAYRSLVVRYHPDTGGSHEDFLALQQHYKILQRHAQ